MSEFKGVWIPAKVWECEELKLIEKHFLCQIYSLDNSKGCFASNSKFAEFFKISNPRCTQIIKSLEDKGFIKITLFREGLRVVKRVINILNKGSKLIKEGGKKTKQPSKYFKEGVVNKLNDSNKEEFSNTISNKESVKDTHTKKIESENEKLKEQIEELKILNEKQRKKVALKKESQKMPVGLSSFNKMEYRRKNKTWTQLDTNFNGGFKMPKEWDSNLQNEVLGHWIYLDEKKGQNWGTTGTLSAQINLINDWLKKYSPIQIIESLTDCQQRGNVTPNPQWTINRKLKAKKDEEQQTTNNGKSIYENYADMLKGNSHDNDNDTIDVSWAEA